MKLTSKNVKELRIVYHWCPDFLKKIEPDDESIKLYFDWSDRGKNKKLIEEIVAEENRTKKFTYLSALYFGKRYRDLQITSYRQDWGETVTAWDFDDAPLEIAEFIARTLKKPMIMEAWWESWQSNPCRHGGQISSTDGPAEMINKDEF